MTKLLNLPAIIGALPATLANGTTADATQVMADLNWIVNQVNANAAPLLNTALLNANNNFSVVQSGIAASAAANFPIASQVQNGVFNTLTSSLGTNTITSRIAALALGAYASGQVFAFTPSQTNTGPVGITIDGAGSSSIFSRGASLIGGELIANVPAILVRDASKLNLVGPTPPQFKIINTTFDMATATGTTLVITGVGFKPRLVEMMLGFTSASSSGCESFGWSDGTTECANINYLGAVAAGQRAVTTGTMGQGVQGAGVLQSFSIATGGSLDSDGCTIKNSKTGGPAGSVNVSLKFMR